MYKFCGIIYFHFSVYGRSEAISLCLFSQYERTSDVVALKNENSQTSRSSMVVFAEATASMLMQCEKWEKLPCHVNAMFVSVDWQCDFNRWFQHQFLDLLDKG